MGLIHFFKRAPNLKLAFYFLCTLVIVAVQL